jgi:hypothetical protein
MNLPPKFSNHRQWREFIAAVHESATAVTDLAWSGGRLSGARKPLGMRINIALGLPQETDQGKPRRDGEVDR